MKKFFYLFLIGLVCAGFAACSDDDDDWEKIEPSQLPSQARSFLDTYWQGYDVALMEVEGSGQGATYEVTLTNGVEIEFDGTGLWVDVDAPMGMSIPTTFINQGIVSYISLNYPMQGINEISREYYGYDIELTNDLDLSFDNMGNLLRGPY